MMAEELVFEVLLFGGKRAVPNDLAAVAAESEVLSMVLVHLLQLIIKVQ